MNPCNPFQDQLLDHLYGLLDAPEVARLTDHLSGCAACRQALAQAEAQKGRLAAAAKLEFPNLNFQKPAATVSAVHPARPVAPARAADRSWGRWALAAAVLLAVGGVSLSALGYWGKRDQVLLAQARAEQVRQDIERSIAERSAKLVGAGREVQETDQALAALSAEYTQSVNEVRQTLARRTMRLQISGPAAPEAGALNEYQVVVRSPNMPQAPEVTAKLLDRDNKEVKAQVDVQHLGANNFRLALPRDLPAKPNTDLFLVVNAKAGGAGQGELTEKLTLAPPVYLTHLATDKPMYQPGEVVHFRSLTLERFSLKPAQEELHLQYEITKPTGEKVQVLAGPARVADQAGKPVLGPDRAPVRGVGAGEFPVAADAPGGEYTLTVRETAGRFPPQERKFIVNQYEKSRLNKKLEFGKKSYGPGDEAVATGKAFQAETNLPVADRPVTATVRIDGTVTATLSLRTTAAGEVRVPFRLPAQIAKGQGSLALRFDDGGNVETIVRPIPIVLKKLQVEFFPEGGDLVAGLTNRVYFQARTTLDKPAELRGRIVDEAGQVQAAAETLNDPAEPGVNQGMGRFAFTPQAGKKYELKIDAPAGMEGKYPLPEVKADGVVLTVPRGVTTDKEPIRVELASAKEGRRLLVGAYCRGRLMTHQRVTVAAGRPTSVELRPEAGAGGVYRVTVFEEQATPDDRVLTVPRAERLVYRVPAQRLDVSVEPDKKEYAPGDPVTLRYVAKNEAGQAQPALLMVAVVDKRIIETADEKTYRSMPTHFLLTTEVRKPEDLEYADFLLGKHAKAARALDLLLGTQGWRRFAEQERPDQFRRRGPQDANRLLATSGRVSPATLGPKVIDSDALAWQEVNDRFAPRYRALQDRKVKAVARQEEARAEGVQLENAIARLNGEATAAERAYRDAVQYLEDYKDLFRTKLLPGLVGLLLLGLIAGVVTSLVRSRGWGNLPYLATGVCAVLILGAAVYWQVQSSRTTSASGDHLAYGTLTKQGTTAAPHTEPGLDDRLNDDLNMAKDPGNDPKKAGAKKELGDVERRFGALGVPGMNQPGGQGRGGAVPQANFAMPARAPDAFARPQAAGMPAGAKGDHGKAFPGRDGAFDKAKGEAELLEMQKRMPAARYAGVAQPEGLLEKMQEAAKPGEAGATKATALRKEFDGKRRPADRELRQVPDLAAAATPPPLARPMPAGDMPLGKDMDRVEALGGRADLRRRGWAGELSYLAGLQPPAPPLVVREYAHRRVNPEGDVRSDFTETLLWQPVVVLPDGTGRSTFQLCDSTTTFQILAAGHTADGRLGAVTADLTARKPLTVEPKLPVEVTANDRIDVPLAVANNTGAPQAVGLNVGSAGLNLLDGRENATLTLTPHQRNRLVYRFQPSLVEGEATLRFEGKSGQFTDHILRTLKVVPEGFPIAGAQSDMLEKVARHELLLPPTWIKGTLKYQVTVYPSTLASLQKGLEALLREPNGCFEQTSTSNYPNLLILDYLKETDQADAAVAQRAGALLDRGYKKLTSFECLNPGKNAREGYEWFGGTAPAHEALTAYGLLEFRDMARVYPVDRAMLDRTRTYLMSRRDGKGGFQRNPRAIDTFGRAPDHVTNAYIVWSLTESGKEDDVTRELNALAEQAKSSKDPYFVALVANSLLNRDRRPEAADLLKKLADAQKPDGHLDAEKTSITGSGGRDLQIETTSLTLLGWLKAGRPELFNVPTQKAVKWIGQQRGGYGGFGSTQSTILALKALIAYAKANKKTAEAGELTLSVGEQVVAKQAFPAGAQDAIVLDLPEPEKHLKPGKNELSVAVTGKSVFPYTAGWTYQSLQPANAADCPVKLTTTLDRPTAAEGETVGLTVKVENRSGKGQGMAVAIVGLPAGLTLPEDMKQLKDMARLRENGTKRGEIDAWETRGRELVLYWRDLAPDQKIGVHFDLIARVPGEYRGPASRAYLYYNADHKFWAEPLKVTVGAKAE